MEQSRLELLVWLFVKEETPEADIMGQARAFILPLSRQLLAILEVVQIDDEVLCVAIEDSFRPDLNVNFFDAKVD